MKFKRRCSGTARLAATLLKIAEKGSNLKSVVPNVFKQSEVSPRQRLR